MHGILSVHDAVRYRSDRRIKPGLNVLTDKEFKALDLSRLSELRKDPCILPVELDGKDLKLDAKGNPVFLPWPDPPKQEPQLKLVDEAAPSPQTVKKPKTKKK